jgi:hypothetical protein
MNLLAPTKRLEWRVACVAFTNSATLASCVPACLMDNPTEPLALHPSPSEFMAGPYLIRSKPGEMLVVLKASLQHAVIARLPPASQGTGPP